MNMETANRLANYRKKAGLSQEELANKLGVSRQAVSKWECGESSPDTDNLIELSRIYGVTLDELLNVDPKDNNKGFHVNDGGDEVHITNEGIHVKDSDGSQVHVTKDGVEVIDPDGRRHGTKHFDKKDAINTILSSCLALSVVIAYLLIGFLVPDGWRNYWVLFFLIPLVPSLFEAIRKRKFTVFAYPVFVVGLYLTLGMFIGIWHPTWILFLTIPLYYTIFGPIDRLNKQKRIDSGRVVIDNSVDEDGDVDHDED